MVNGKNFELCCVAMLEHSLKGVFLDHNFSRLYKYELVANENICERMENMHAAIQAHKCFALFQDFTHITASNFFLEKAKFTTIVLFASKR